MFYHLAAAKVPLLQEPNWLHFVDSDTTRQLPGMSTSVIILASGQRQGRVSSRITEARISDINMQTICSSSLQLLVTLLFLVARSRSMEELTVWLLEYLKVAYMTFFMLL